MLKPTDKTALVTHRNCLDGTGAAAIFILAGGKRENVIFRDPKGCALSAKQAADFDEVWFVDVCPWDLTDPAGGKPWRVLDHHDTNIRRHGRDRANCSFDETKCGTSMLAAAVSSYEDGYIGATIRELVETIEHYDLGRFDVNYHVKQLADLATTYTQSELLDIFVSEKTDLLYRGYYQNRGIAIGAAREIFAENAVRGAYAETIIVGDREYNCAIAVAPRDWGNDVAMRLLDGRLINGMIPDFSVVVDVTRNSVSLRSKLPTVNVAKIAEAFGGGGHPRAAGIRLDNTAAYKLLLEGIFG